MSILSGLWAGAKLVMGLGSAESNTGTDNVMAIAKGVGGFIDEQNFTTEEQAVYNSTMISAMGRFMEGTVDENTQRSKTRREVAIMVIRWALAMLTLSAILHLAGQADHAKYIRDLVIDDPIGYLVLGVGAFFFGAHIVRAMKNGK